MKSVVNVIKYFYSRDNGKMFDELAESDLLPGQVAGYVKNVIMFGSNIMDVKEKMRRRYDER